MGLRNKFTWTFLMLSLLCMKTSDGDGVRLPDQVSSDPQQNYIQQQEQQQQHQQQQHQQQQTIQQQQPIIGEGRRQGKDLLDLIGLGTGANVDPYVARTNTNCLSGDLSECFKTHALSSLDDFFVKESYTLTDSVRVVRMPETHQRSLFNDPFEFSSEPRSTDSEWEQLVKFALRKIERFVKSAALEVKIPDEITESGRYSPRFVDDIADEIDVIEDKKAPFFTRHKLKKLFIPLLLVLKIFKLKLLLFLPFILGLASFKKILGLAAIVLPGVFAYFKLCRPQQSFGNFYANNDFPQYTPQGVGAASYHTHDHFLGPSQFFRQEPSFVQPYNEYYSKSTGASVGNVNGIRFGEHAQDLAYQGYAQYRSNNKEAS